MKVLSAIVGLLGWALSLLAAPLDSPSDPSADRPRTVAPPEQGRGSRDDDGVHIDYDEPTPPPNPEDGAWPYAPPIEQVFANPAIVSGIANSADAINRSVESLMDSLFYSLLDNEKNWPITETTWFATNLKRDVFSTPTGAYVVVDRVELGPRYSRLLGTVQGVPITLGMDGTAEILQIYLRSDGMRLAEQAQLSPLRRWLNNWVGVLPTAAKVLPPSFNENELYDPITQLQTPLSFPLKADEFYEMPIGSIRSYALSGGVRLVADLAGTMDQAARRLLERVGDVQATLPAAVFRRGEHRINVLRRSEHSAWIGVSELSRTGAAFSPLLGQKYFILKGALAARIFDWNWIWAGVPIAVLPIDAEFGVAAAELFDQVFEFDMRNPIAVEAYEAATQGDFVPAKERWLDSRAKDVNTGVTFHFTRQQERNESQGHLGANVAVFRRERQRDHTAADIEITDEIGRFYILESGHEIADKQWDILVGDEETRVQHTAELRVQRVAQMDADDPDAEPEYSYEFVPDGEKYRLTVNLTIQDRYVNTTEYYSYLETLRFFTALGLMGVPDLDIRDREAIVARRQRTFFIDPGAATPNIHVTPTHLGRFGAQASVSFSQDQIDRIFARSEDDLWETFARTFGQDEIRWRDPIVRASLGFQAQWWPPFLLYPTRLLGIRFPKIDAVKETADAIREIAATRDAVSPIEKRDAFHRLLNTDHPLYLTRALLNLSDMKQIPRRVVFSAQPKGEARHEVRAEFGKLNNMTFRDGPPFPDPGRYARAKAQLANFYLDQPRESQSRPRLVGIRVLTRPIPESVRGIGDEPENQTPLTDHATRHVVISFTTANLPAPRSAKLYVRVDQAGKIKIGKLNLAEQVIDLTPIPQPTSDPKSQAFEFWLTGPMSPISNYLYDQAVAAGDEFLVTLAISSDGLTWSDERTVEFRFENGLLTPPK